MITEQRDRWECWIVAHGGEGPGRIGERTVVHRSLEDVLLPQLAEDAAERYAAAMMADDEEYDDGSYIFVGVAVKRGDQAVGAFRCVKRVKFDVDVDEADWITPEALRP